MGIARGRLREEELAEMMRTGRDVSLGPKKWAAPSPGVVGRAEMTGGTGAIRGSKGGKS